MNKYNQLSDQELDQLFRDAYQAEAVEPFFVPEYWSEMAAMLPKQEKAIVPMWLLVAIASIYAISLLVFPVSRAHISLMNESTRLVETKNIPTETLAQALPQVESNEISSVQHQPLKNQQQVQNTQTIHHSTEDEELIKKIQNRTASNQSASTVITTDESKNTNSDVEDFALNLPKRDVQVPTYPIHAIQTQPIATKERMGSWYLELGPTIGQSPYLSQNAKRNLIGGAVLGGGYSWRFNNTVFGLGVQFRMEGFGGLQYRETNFATNMQRTVTVNQLFSLDLPLRFGFMLKKSELAFAFIPGVQLFSHGKEEITENQQITREGSYTGKVEHSNSLTMELGLNYYYHFTDKWSLGAKLQTDILRPLHTDYYIGKSISFPINGQVVLRRQF